MSATVALSVDDVEPWTVNKNGKEKEENTKVNELLRKWPSTTVVKRSIALAPHCTWELRKIAQFAFVYTFSLLLGLRLFSSRRVRVSEFTQQSHQPQPEVNLRTIFLPSFHLEL
ncbi:hypothetical protein EV2_015163 [Malus domestica]